MSKPTFEDRLKRLSEIVEILEKGELPLEEGVALFKEGQELAKACAAQLETARTEIQVAGEGLLETFEDLKPEDGNVGEG